MFSNNADPFFCLVAKSHLRLLFIPIYFYSFSVCIVSNLNIFGVS